MNLKKWSPNKTMIFPIDLAARADQRGAINQSDFVPNSLNRSLIPNRYYAWSTSWRHQPSSGQASAAAALGYWRVTRGLGFPAPASSPRRRVHHHGHLAGAEPHIAVRADQPGGEAPLGMQVAEDVPPEPNGGIPETPLDGRQHREPRGHRQAALGTIAEGLWPGRRARPAEIPVPLAAPLLCVLVHRAGFQSEAAAGAIGPQLDPATPAPGSADLGDAARAPRRS